ncbi:TonB-dependent receptor [Lacinutrix sp. C3R15]|uniref:TonB-dependent receptor n=1 Tax=Flavobacteriaceae TaxID=49546 RepID=UPI001C096B08|nr:MULTISPECIES: TonB-dependent receptor [Flavobacteriaceae]MBU2938952.1 TonB-dependent receptor [Lacinutrix sp. C3R15]MDO6622265.1 TonB-dependent receptor [Oceanihabitans sp. 1_MG-2023]
MKKIIFVFIFLLSLTVAAQSIKGIVTDIKNNPIPQANVYLKGTYDGSTTNKKGEFLFKTTAKGTQTLVVSFIGFETYTMIGDISYMNDLKIQLREDVNSLDAVILSAGTFSAGDNSKVNALKPLDVVTTASALGDFVGALQTLPGTTTVAEDGRLFVRGGEADETQIFIDGIKVFTPYSPSANNTPTRGRYSPFLFDGITFSTGGYSAEYGQALSSVLLLNTTGEPDQEKTDISIMTVGAALGNTQKWKNNSLSVNASYINLAPYNALFKDRNDWIKPVEAASGEAVFRQKTNKGMLKLYTAFDASNFELIQEDINTSEGVHFKLNNNNLYFNGSYKGMLTDSWTLQTGMSYTHAKDKINIEETAINDTQNSFHAKLKLKHRFSNRFKLNFGAEYMATDFNENYKDIINPSVDYGFNNNISAAFTEADILFSKNFALKAGVRLEHSALFDEVTLSPRASMAYKVSNKSQLSLAYGDFYQNPNSDILKFEQDVQAQHTSHYILNYQYNSNKQIFRAEAYYKKYTDLVKYDSEFTSFDANYNNQGKGFAKGIDLFWRDNSSIKNIDYWVSYSLLDSERVYKNYSNAAQPNFANTHNLSVVGKYWVDNWKSQIGLSYTFASGRTYTNPNETGFLNQKTKAYNSLSLNWAYLLSPQKILYFSVNNVLGFKNINGYQFADQPDSNGNFASRSLRPANDQFFFVGFFWTISEKGTDNQLNKL